jgi:hypothetical protein
MRREGSTASSGADNNHVVNFGRHNSSVHEDIKSRPGLDRVKVHVHVDLSKMRERGSPGI